MEKTHFGRYKPLLDDWPAFVSAVKRPLPSTIWANPARISADDLAQLMSQGGIELQPIPWQPGAFRLPDDIQPGLRWEYLAGLYHVQEEVSLLPVSLLDLQPTDRVLDMCAAPGNKTAQMGLMMGNRGTIVAVDRNGGRMRAARQVFNRLGIVNVTAVTHDAANLPGSMGHFDKILVDAPCTCEGTCRKDPDIIRRVSDRNHQKMAGKQISILRKAVQLCRPGGRIVYATCTFAPEENEMVVDRILRKSDGRVQLIPAAIPGFRLSPGVTQWQGETFDSSLALALRAWPQHNDTGGFFMAVLEKSSVPNDQPVEAAQAAAETYAAILQRDPWVELVANRFGIPQKHFKEYDILRWSRRGAWLINQDHRPPEAPKPDSIGMMFLRPKGKYPKLTTASSLLLGQYAHQNVIDLQPGQVQAFYGREEFAISDNQLKQCTGSGYVLLRFQNFPLGIGILRTAKQMIESTFPKGWSRTNVQI